MTYETITLQEEKGIALITINRPDRLNALNLTTFADLDKGMDYINANDDIRGVLVTGSGEKAFVAGADITEISGLSRKDGTRFSETGQAVFQKIEYCRKPVIALINGFALGGGCELAMACHLRIAAETARFGQPEVNLGLIPGYGGTQRLPRLVGRGRAMELLLTAEMISAGRAYEIGLVNQVVPQGALEEAGLKMMNTILSKGPKAVAFMLQVVHEGLNQPLEEGIRLEAEYFGKACATEDMKEGTSAFLEKRRAVFEGK